ncbi:hypothetical protein CHS0354_004851 [Potamilus streckersoni]|uniref:Uncharacterized protein n=1 Tax=Potamilus streckersoni TaxID=2493646 RepID=A0AAE0S907_9BIVA|nr:hypothetical protein CHS0354_004851 [Potamilus streckersoni]
MISKVNRLTPLLLLVVLVYLHRVESYCFASAPTTDLLRDTKISKLEGFYRFNQFRRYMKFSKQNSKQNEI